MNTEQKRNFYFNNYTELIHDFGEGPLRANNLLEGYFSILDHFIKYVGTPKEYTVATANTKGYYKELARAAEHIYNNQQKYLISYGHFKEKEIPVTKILRNTLNPYTGFDKSFWQGLNSHNLNPDGVTKIYSYKIHERASVKKWQACKWLCNIDIVDKIDFDTEPTTQEREILCSNDYHIGKTTIFLDEQKHPFKEFPFAITFKETFNHEKVKLYWLAQGGEVKEKEKSLRVFDNKQLAFVFGSRRILFDRKYSNALIDYLRTKPLAPN